MLVTLMESRVYRDYERDFARATDMPLSLHPPESPGLVRFTHAEPAFCTLMARSPGTCGGCRAFQRQLEHGAQQTHQTLPCYAGLCETAVPVRAGGRLIAFLRTGHVRLHPARKSGFRQIARALLQLDPGIDLEKAEAAWFRTPVISPERYAAIVRLLTIFAGHLGLLAERLPLQPAAHEPKAVTRARDFVAAHFRDELTMPDVARAVHMSANHFSETFKQATGLDFTDYLARIRTENARTLLLDPHRRIGEIAFESGFQSLSQFNRTFKKLTGQSPSEYREKIARGM